MIDPRTVLGPTLADAIEALVAERVEAALAELRDGERRLLPVAEAAVELGMTASALRKATARGHVPTVRIGRRVFVDMGALRS